MSSRVKLRKTRSGHYISGLPPIADIQRNETHPCLARRPVAVRRRARYGGGGGGGGFGGRGGGGFGFVGSMGQLIPGYGHRRRRRKT
jgi:hypothetical protein